MRQMSSQVSRSRSSEEHPLLDTHRPSGAAPALEGHAILDLCVLGLAAAVTVGIFFGVGLFLLIPPPSPRIATQPPTATAGNGSAEATTAMLLRSAVTKASSSNADVVSLSPKRDEARTAAVPNPARNA